MGQKAVLNVSETQNARTERGAIASCRRADGTNGVKSNKTLSDGYPEVADLDCRPRPPPRLSLYPNLYTKT
jgi:hypothetical protein